ncbi:chromosome segregation protein SMC [Staphylococcus simulans]|uniref:chromosome segregation protein SMC n=1 Tax=Staphylococcus simulans TaxID=1286 RepID=UPI000CD1F3A4|nr:chromosome segregation protein SMC [Staphylococcus simulans]PNZ45413.1 chromosome segregation protein SMC [Staphylococcus simulans]SQE74425.1 putative chromosome segregation protein SMC [Staphylococcus simulans]VED60656.1 putative chromosome segregation protein SMC [Staphylococcus simulans]
MVYLKSINAVGFKSFAQQTEVHFDQGVTAIVGPNGSGKSNVTDAIKWVLGEQSAKSLRGSKMEDIIFSGAEHRKAQNYAEVRLKLDNHAHQLNVEEDEIIVTRRLYRSGESAYYLNNERARLRDITDLFLDSGLGKEAFSIISQGRVDEILNAKPADRRQIIEESAGVLKYKKRKAASVQKLDQTEENLNRVEDILYDLEGRVEPLREEAAIAKEYQHLSKEMKKSDVLVTVHDINEYNEAISKADERLNILKSQQAQKEADQNRYSRTLANYKAELNQQNDEIERLNYQLVQATEAAEKLSGQLNVLEERKRNQSQTNARYEEEQEALQAQHAQLIEDQQQAKADKQTLTEKQQSLAAEVKKLEDQLYVSDADHEEQLEEIKNSYYDLMSEQSEVNNDIRFLQRTIEENEAKQNRLDSRLLDAFNQLKSIQSEINQITAQQKEKQQQLASLEQQQKDNEAQLTETKNKQNEYEEKLYQAYRYTDKLKAKIESLTSREEDYTYFFNGVKHVLKAKNNPLNGIHGAVAEVIDVPSELTTAIETALGASMQHIIVDTEKDGRQAIAYLKQNRLGRATFLPLNVIQPRRLQADIMNTAQQATGFVGVAADLISVDNTYSAIIYNLVGNTIIVDDLKHANELAQAIRYRTRIVTLEGDIVNPGGSMTGGGQRQTKSILAQRDELTQLREQLKQFEQQTTQFEKEVQAVKDEANQLSETYLKISQQYNEAKQAVHNIELELDRLKKSEAHIKSEHEEFEFEKNDGYQSEKSRETLEAKQQQKEQLAKKLADLEQQIESLTQLSKEGKESTAQLQQQLHQKQSDLAVLKERSKTQRQQLERIDNQIKQNQLQQEKLAEDIELFNSDEVTGQKAFETIQKDIEIKQQEKADLNERLDVLKGKRQETNASIEEFDDKLQETHRDILSIENSYQDIKAEQSKLDVLISHSMDHLNDDYHLTFEAAKDLYEQDEPIDALRQKVKLTKMSIEELGPVNLNAIEQFEEVYERFTFLDEQRTDLREAKATLEQIIREMDQAVMDRFKTTFHAVQGHFSEVFKSLFGGGQAELKLTDDDYLTAGVEIIVQPPGKKLQHLSLLSGGERALSAIALLFALLKVRSAPFVILDEVEAALDEANVIRYANYLRQLSEKTQFIVITHRKGTMEAADRLYGITMQESGVSKLVSVNLNTIDEVLKEEEK